MAELATPSAAAIGTSDTTAATNGTSTPTGTAKSTPPTRPEKPDESLFKEAVEKARKALNDAQQATKTAQERVNAGRPSKDSPVAKQREELRAQLTDIRTKQQGFKSSRNGTQDKIKALDTQLKSRIQEQKNAKAKIPFRNIEELDREIARLQSDVDSGKMKLVDEKKSLTEISGLNKQRRAFAGFDETEKTISDLKSQVAELRSSLDNPEYKSLSDEYTRITTELDSLKADQDAAFKDLNASRDALTAARANQDEKYASLKKIQDDYYSQRRAFMDYDREANRQRAIKRKQEQEKYFLDKKRKDLDRDLEEASYPAYSEQIRACDNLIRLLDPASAKKETTSLPGQFAAVASRIVEATGIKGTPLAKKNVDEEEYFAGGGGKKNKKGRKNQRGGGGGGAGTASPALGDVEQTDAVPASANVDLGRFFDPAVVAQFDTVQLTPPSSQEEVGKILEQLKEKKAFWAGDEKRKTDENIAAVQKRIDALMSGASEEEDDTTSAPATAAATATATASSSSSAAATAEPASAESNGVTNTASQDSTEDELRQLAAEDGSAEESTMAPVGDQDGAEVDGAEEVTETLAMAKLDGEGKEE